MKHGYRLLMSITILLLFKVLILSCATTTPSVDNTSIVENNYHDDNVFISDVEAIQKRDGVEILVRASKSFDYKTYRFDNPARLAIDIPDCRLKNVPADMVVEKGAIQTIKNSEFKNEKEVLSRIEITMIDDNAANSTINLKGNTLSIFFPGEMLTADVEAEAEIITAKKSAPELLSQVEASTPQMTTKASSIPFVKIAQASQVPGGGAQLLERTIDTEEAMDAEMDQTYEGIPISLDLKDADIIDIFLTISELSGYNIIVDPDVKGKVNIRMTDVPWDQTLDIILKQMNLGKEYTGSKSPEFPRGNIIRIAKINKLKREAEDRRSLADAKKTAEPLVTKIFYLNYATASDMQRNIKKFLSKRGEIIVDKRTNSLIITDNVGNLEKVKNMIYLLDVRTKQVLISSQIVTTKKDFTRDLGIQWGGKFVADAFHGNTTGYRFPNNYAIDGTANGGYAVNLPAGDNVLGISLGNVLDTLQLNFMLTASETEGLTKVISSPRVMTSDNIVAEIKTGTQIAYTVYTDRGLEIQFKDAVISLKVTPHITNDNFVNMKIEAKKNSPDFSVSPPAINTNQAKTEVLVKDGDTIVIGGLNNATEGWSEARLPWLHRIPGIGWLFKNKSLKNEYDDLLIFISPKIVHQKQAKAQVITFDQSQPPPQTPE
ncbi:type IV pilus secretin PilQ [candidate division CSSED10-310 bacterium]|uniref:Type IV pilus secretin PilQ n=1 Tax=candidate division CSSED10-310 bacterium TaxID=2855610 RepID=A0ABV6Z2G1_UNCC1